MAEAYQILVDSTCDLPASFYQEHQVNVIDLEYILEGKTYLDNSPEMDRKTFYDKIRQGAMPTTNMVNIGRYIEFFEPYLRDGKDILHLSFSAALSGSHQAAVSAAADLSERYPERKIAVVDSTCASMGHGLLLHYVIGKRDEGLSLEELREWIEEKKAYINHLFTVDNLMHLHRGGRVSKASAMMGTMLGIKPMLDVSLDGRLIPKQKVRGRKAALQRLVSWMQECTDLTRFDMVMISHGDSLDDANYVRDLVAEHFTVDQFLINPIGPVIGTHSGPGTIALFFWGNTRV